MELRDEIAKVAYELYEKNGRQHGKHEEHWIEAERIVRARHAGQETVEEPAKEPLRPAAKRTAEKSATARKAQAKPRKTSPATTKPAKKAARKTPAK